MAIQSRGHHSYGATDGPTNGSAQPATARSSFPFPRLLLATVLGACVLQAAAIAHVVELDAALHARDQAVRQAPAPAPAPAPASVVDVDGRGAFASEQGTAAGIAYAPAASATAARAPPANRSVNYERMRLRVRGLIREKAARWNSSFSVGFRQRGARWSAVGGYDDHARGTAVSNASLFPLGSVTKPFTASAIMQLVAKGAFALDARIAPLVDPPLAAWNGSSWAAYFGKVGAMLLLLLTVLLMMLLMVLLLSLPLPLLLPLLLFVLTSLLKDPRAANITIRQVMGMRR